MTEEELKAALEKAQKEIYDLRIQEVRNELSEARLEETARIRRDRLWRDIISQFFSPCVCWRCWRWLRG